MAGVKSQPKPEFAEFARTHKPQAGAVAWIKTIPEYPTIIEVYDRGKGTYEDAEGVRRLVTPTTLHRWLLARGYDAEVCRIGKIKHWCEEAAQGRAL